MYTDKFSTGLRFPQIGSSRGGQGSDNVQWRGTGGDYTEVNEGNGDPSSFIKGDFRVIRNRLRPEFQQGQQLATTLPTGTTGAPGAPPPVIPVQKKQFGNTVQFTHSRDPATGMKPQEIEAALAWNRRKAMEAGKKSVDSKTQDCLNQILSTRREQKLQVWKATRQARKAYWQQQRQASKEAARANEEERLRYLQETQRQYEVENEDVEEINAENPQNEAQTMRERGHQQTQWEMERERRRAEEENRRMQQLQSDAKRKEMEFEQQKRQFEMEANARLEQERAQRSFEEQQRLKLEEQLRLEREEYERQHEALRVEKERELEQRERALEDRLTALEAETKQEKLKLERELAQRQAEDERRESGQKLAIEAALGERYRLEQEEKTRQAMVADTRDQQEMLEHETAVQARRALDEAQQREADRLAAEEKEKQRVAEEEKMREMEIKVAKQNSMVNKDFEDMKKKLNQVKSFDLLLGKLEAFADEKVKELSETWLPFQLPVNQQLIMSEGFRLMLQDDLEKGVRDEEVALLVNSMVSFVEVHAAIENKTLLTVKEKLMASPHCHIDGSSGCGNDKNMPHPSLVPVHHQIGRSTHVVLGVRGRGIPRASAKPAVPVIHMYMHVEQTRTWMHVNTLCLEPGWMDSELPKFENLLVATHFLNIDPPYGVRHLPIRMQVYDLASAKTATSSGSLIGEFETTLGDLIGKPESKLVLYPAADEDDDEKKDDEVSLERSQKARGELLITLMTPWVKKGDDSKMESLQANMLARRERMAKEAQAFSEHQLWIQRGKQQAAAAQAGTSPNKKALGGAAGQELQGREALCNKILAEASAAKRDEELRSIVTQALTVRTGGDTSALGSARHGVSPWSPTPIGATGDIPMSDVTRKNGPLGYDFQQYFKPNAPLNKERVQFPVPIVYQPPEMLPAGAQQVDGSSSTANPPTTNLAAYYTEYYSKYAKTDPFASGFVAAAQLMAAPLATTAAKQEFKAATPPEIHPDSSVEEVKRRKSLSIEATKQEEPGLDDYEETEEEKAEREEEEKAKKGDEIAKKAAEEAKTKQEEEEKEPDIDDFAETEEEKAEREEEERMAAEEKEEEEKNE